MASNRRVVVENRKARHDYEILETYEAGIVLKGSEVKSIREGRVSLVDSYATVENGEVILHNLHIAPYESASHFGHDPKRPRKLLLNKYEIKRLIGKVKEKGLTLIPLKIYFKKHLVKVELALVRGKRKYEKREAIKRRMIEEEIQRALKREKR
ncbi:MAG TPA: SsrA-binding protein SmpB [candidate division WOR-3 bacterium]|uniref:SsrA-binding protein n=1 Tax=candidate division WOR-3 bacterium TaxID=2052148 RepID=A0A7C0XAD3_UNCW3|nr:SsrA-binding protein SmpB [candidate division WOR-3 bacterium]